MTWNVVSSAYSDISLKCVFVQNDAPIAVLLLYRKSKRGRDTSRFLNWETDETCGTGKLFWGFFSSRWLEESSCFQTCPEVRTFSLNCFFSGGAARENTNFCKCYRIVRNFFLPALPSKISRECPSGPVLGYSRWTAVSSVKKTSVSQRQPCDL